MSFPKTILISLANPIFSMGVNILSAVLKSQKYDVSTIYFVPRIKMFQTFENYSEQDYEALVDKCIELDPDIIGISVYSGFFQSVVRITEELKRKKDFLIIWGGIHPTIDPENSIKYADIICRGEGEQAIVDLVQALQNKSPTEYINNLWVRKKEKIIKNPVKLLENLDAIPFPEVSDNNKYILSRGSIIPLHRKYSFYSLMTSRGCFFSCSYCSNQEIKNVYDHYHVRRRSVDNVMEEISSVLRDNPNIKRLYFNDDVFTFDTAWINDFAKRYKEDIGLPFFCYTHPKLIKEELIKGIKDAGCNLISMGIQGSSMRMRQIFNRKTSEDELIKACHIITKYKFDQFYLDIIFSPFDTPEDYQEGLELLLRLPKPFYVAMHTLTFFPKSGITKVALEKGLISEKDIVSNLSNPPHQLGNYRDIIFTPEGKWWCLYALCGKKFIPNSFIRISKAMPGMPLVIFFLYKMFEKIQLMFNKRNVFTR